MKTMKPASEWCEEMFGQGNWVVADEITIKAIQDDAKLQGRILIRTDMRTSKGLRLK